MLSDHNQRRTLKMANANVVHVSAHGVSSTENLDEQVRELKASGPLINPEQLEDLFKLSKSSNLNERPIKLLAWLANQDGNFFHGLTQDANSARMVAPTCEVMEKLAARMQMVADLAAMSAQRVRLAGSTHGEAFQAWCKEEPTGAAAHV